MATEKQIGYVGKLVEGLRPENMPWWADESAPRKWVEKKRRDWVLNVLGINCYSAEAKALSYDEAVQRYNDALDEVLARVDNMSTREASQCIDSLKNCSLKF